MRVRSKEILVALGVAGAAMTPSLADAQHAHGAEATQGPRVPEGLQREHREVHAELEWVTKRGGRTGAAARALVAVLHPHFRREEQVALPPLGLLGPLARGGRPSDGDTRVVLALTDTLRRELPAMLREHEAIHAATMKLREAAAAERNARAVRFADKLAAHAAQEEELSYPAALLVGELLRRGERRGSGQ